jgi:L-malate glycosyltransferase
MKTAVLGPAHIPELLSYLDQADARAARFIHGMGGYSITALVRARLDRGYFTHLITCDLNASSLQQFHGPKFVLSICPRRENRALRTLYSVERYWLSRALKSVDVDVVHANWTYEYALAALASPLPHIITVRDHAWRMLTCIGRPYLPLYLLTRYVFMKGLYFTAPSQYIADYIARHSKKSVTIIPNNLSDQLCDRGAALDFTSCPSRPVIVSAISAAPFKGAKIALEAFAIFHGKFPKARYLVAGPGLGEDSEIARWCTRRRLNHGVQFMGQISHEDWLRLVEQAHVVLHPSLEESFGNVLVEGMAMKRLVVAGSRTGACPWVLGDGKAGVLVDVRKPQEIANALCNIFSCWEANAGKIDEATRLVESRYSSEVVTGQYQDVYSSLINEERCK